MLEATAAKRGYPRSIVTDNGPEFIGRALDAWSYEHKVRLNFIQPGKQTPFIESFNGKFCDECPNQHWFEPLRHARAEISIWRDDCNNIRPHSALANLAPVQYVQTLTTKGFSTVQNALS